MTEPRKIDRNPITIPKTNWDEVRRRQERTQALLSQMREAQLRLERIVERAAGTGKQDA
jgi:hypothetical protein